MTAFDTLIAEARRCSVCAPELPEGPRPVFQMAPSARILIAGQAPGSKVHATGVPFDDASGDRLRSWMGLTKDQFYTPSMVAILPMGFCYPGRGRSGDLPPQPECAPLWRKKMLAQLTHLQLTLVIGQYAMDWHLGGARKRTLTATVRAWEEYISSGILPLPHPSPRNNIWLKKNPWFEDEIVPVLREKVRHLVAHTSG